MSRDIEDIISSSDVSIKNIKRVSNLLVHDIEKFCSEEKVSVFIQDIVDYYKSNDYINERGFECINNEYSKKEKQIWKNLITKLRRKHHINPSTVSLNYFYYKMLQNSILTKRCKQLEMNNTGKHCRATSGITQITVVSSPYPNGQAFSCEYNCYYCPNEPAHEGNNWQAQPRSYLYNEPAVRRANTNNFDAALQMWDRMSALLLCGLKVDKLEVMVLGGTWASYPEDYREEFVRDLYYAANTFYDDMIIKDGKNIQTKRKRYSLEEEIRINEKALVRVIGLTLETRPDCVTAHEIELFRRYNCTRVQIGVQHTDKRILSKINRGCYTEDTIRAIANLLNVGLKVDIHIMFDLPFASQDDDFKMIDTILSSDDLRFDQVKFYPFSSLDWTKTKEWEDAGQQLHYTREELMEVILYAKRNIPEWVRINRVIRDIPSDYITAGNDVPNLRQDIHKEMEKEGWSCQCIRCREPKNNSDALKQVSNAEMVIREYNASSGKEYFISYESPDRKWIYGFCRLRLSTNAGYVIDLPPTTIRNSKDKPQMVNVMPQLNGSALIRELHVYGTMNPVATNSQRVQHRGFGRMLVKKAEEIAMSNGYTRMSIISGVGVREYYERKLGYKLNGTYMEKELLTNEIRFQDFVFALICFVIYLVMIYINI